MLIQRFEWKYLVTPTQADCLIDALLSRGLRWDAAVAAQDDRRYPVTSLYFDSPTYHCYREKRSGLERRFKVRLRGYAKTLGADGTPLYLELKQKIGNLIKKNRVVLGAGARQAFVEKNMRGITALDPDATSDDRRVAAGLKRAFVDFALLPRCVVRYARQPLVGTEANHLRITFDHSLEAYPYERGEAYTATLPTRRMHIMEIKYNGAMPFWLHPLIQKYELERVAYSKYCAAVMTLRSHYLI